MHAVNFGRIERLQVCGGQPVLSPPPRVVYEVKFGGENGPRPERAARNFRLKDQVLELFAELDRLGDGVVETLEIRHGLPFRLTRAEGAR
jgi:hypothetical protein